MGNLEVGGSNPPAAIFLFAWVGFSKHLLKADSCLQKEERN